MVGHRQRRGRRGSVVVVVALALAAGGCSSSGSEGARTTTTTGVTTPRGSTSVGDRPVGDKHPTFVKNECWWPRAAALPTDLTVTCGTVDVEANRTDKTASRLHLAVVRLHRKGADPKAPPIVNLHGGPGSDALSTAPAADTLPLDALKERDMILYDQRGTGRSTPSLNCPENEKATLAALGAADSWSVEFAANEAAAVACKKRLVGEGIDLADYNTPASVEDLETIRKVFHIDTWNVAGRSYGTRLGLAYARAHPKTIRTLLIDSVYPPEVGGVARNTALPSEAFGRLSKACDAQPACRAANGNVEQQLAKAVASFDAHPETITGTVTVDGKDITQSYTLTGGDLRGGIFAALYKNDLIPQLPSVIAALAKGDRSIVPAFLSTGVPGLLQMSEGVFFSFECADSERNYGEAGVEAMRKDPGGDELYALATAEPFCRAWDVPEVPAAFNQPVTANVATLVFGGTLDPITPYTESKAQADSMPNARFVSVPGGGHGDAAFDDCTKSARDGFWHDPKAKLPACLDIGKVRPFVS
ncbi:MAG: alpha/beta fold hydrolase [Acidimicrobiales bacterium]